MSDAIARDFRIEYRRGFHGATDVCPCCQRQTKLTHFAELRFYDLTADRAGRGERQSVEAVCAVCVAANALDQAAEVAFIRQWLAVLGNFGGEVRNHG